MVVDERHDHSFRIPRPDLTETIGTPNACNACHSDRSAAWAAGVLRERRGGKPPPHFGEVLAAGHRGVPDVAGELTTLARDGTSPTIVRATALSLLSSFPGAETRATLAEALAAEDPLLNIGSLRGLYGLAPEERWPLAAPLLHSPLLAVRGEAALALADAGRLPLDGPALSALGQAVADYVRSQRLHADRPEALANARLGDMERAESVPALLNLADLYRAADRDAAARDLLEKALALAPNDAAAHHGYGLWVARNGRPDAALEHLRRATELAPDDIRYAYVLGVALNSLGEPGARWKCWPPLTNGFPATWTYCWH